MNFIFLMDPLDGVIYEKDTSYAFMLGAQRKGHQCYHCLNNGISSKNGSLLFRVTAVTAHDNPDKMFSISETSSLKSTDVDAVFIRTDPPFDAQYLMNTWLLEQMPARAFVMNKPHGIRTVNEKVWATQFQHHMPQTLISSQRHTLLEFLSVIKRGVIKPTDGFGGQGIFKVSDNDSNALVAMETLTHHWQRPIILQEYVPGAEIGDKRVLLLNGEPLGAVLRVHGKTDHRNNFFAGGQPEATAITDQENSIIQELKPHLLALGLHFVGLDFMGEKLIEVNVTSPTCLQEMNRLYNRHLEDKVIAFVEKEISATPP